jgi:hypothetical protein
MSPDDEVERAWAEISLVCTKLEREDRVSATAICLALAQAIRERWSPRPIDELFNISFASQGPSAPAQSSETELKQIEENELKQASAALKEE